MSLQAIKFKDWRIPKTGRMDPFEVPAKGSAFSPFRMHGAIAGYGSGIKPLQEKIHTTTFIFKEGCQADLISKRDRMMRTLLSGQGRLWFDQPNEPGPQVYCTADYSNIQWQPNPDHWGTAQVVLEWQVYNPVLYQPLNSGYMTRNGYTPVTISDDVFGEPGEEHVFASFPVSASPTTFEIVNDGQMRTDSIIIRIESLGVNGYENPRLENLTSEQWVRFAKTGSTVNHVIQANAAIGPHRVRESSDAGQSFVDFPNDGNIWPDTTISDLQVPLMEMVPGENEFSFTCDGTPNCRVLILWRPAYGML